MFMFFKGIRVQPIGARAFYKNKFFCRSFDWVSVSFFVCFRLNFTFIISFNCIQNCNCIHNNLQMGFFILKIFLFSLNRI